MVMSHTSLFSIFFVSYHHELSPRQSSNLGKNGEKGKSLQKEVVRQPGYALAGYALTALEAGYDRVPRFEYCWPSNRSVPCVVVDCAKLGTDCSWPDAGSLALCCTGVGADSGGAAAAFRGGGPGGAKWPVYATLTSLSISVAPLSSDFVSESACRLRSTDCSRYDGGPW